MSLELEYWGRGITAMPFADVVGEAAVDLKARSLRHVAATRDVMLDFGFWYRPPRDGGVRSILLYLPRSRGPIASFKPSDRQFRSTHI